MKAFLVLCVCVAAALATPLSPVGLTDEMIDYINNAQTSWKAGKNFKAGTTVKDVKHLMGVVRGDRTGHVIKEVKVDLEAIPTTFDARQQWPQCTSIGEIRDQASCGSCWAFGAVEAITDRICISTNAALTPHISAEDLNDCCIVCGNGCNGGDPASAWAWWVKDGIVTGGNYNSGQGCEPYTIASCDHHVNGTLPNCGAEVPTPKCTKQCIASYDKTYDEDKIVGAKAYSIRQIVAEIQQEILDYGPVECDFDVYEDFLSYKSGVYHHVTGVYQGGHAVKMIGWGNENGDDYWLIANSWNNEWGDKGLFKILRGTNECGIEADIQAGTPK